MKFGNTLTKLLQQDLESNRAPFLIGDVGIGKSSFCLDLSNQQNGKAFLVPCNQMADKLDLIQERLAEVEDAPTLDERFIMVYVIHPEIKEALDYAVAHPDQHVYLTFDEINRTSADLTSALLTTITMRKLGNHVFPQNLHIIAAGNDRGNITMLDEASLTRFVLYQVEPSTDVFLNIMGSDLHWAIREALQANPQFIFERSVGATMVAAETDDNDNDTNMLTLTGDGSGESMEQLTTPRTIEYLSDKLNTLEDDPEFLRELTITPRDISYRGIDVSNQSQLTEVIYGTVGNTGLANDVLLRITNKIMTPANATNKSDTLSTTKLYRKLTKCQTMSDVENTVNAASMSDRAETLLYVLGTKNTHIGLAVPLADAIDDTQMQSSVIGSLLARSASGLENEEAMTQFMKSSSPLAQKYVDISNTLGGSSI